MAKEIYIPVSVILLCITLWTGLSAVVKSFTGLENRLTKIEVKVENLDRLSQTVEQLQKLCYVHEQQ